MAVASPITVVGAGIAGLWAALALARRGRCVRLLEASPEPFARAASRLAGAMLAPYCEAEAAPRIVRDMGLMAMALWRAAYPRLTTAGALVLAQPRDRAELKRFARLTTAHETLDGARIDALEPDLAGRYAEALFFPDEAHLDPGDAMRFLLESARQAGVEVVLGTEWRPSGRDGLVIDCRGLAARSDLPSLRGVRGERLLLATKDVRLARTVRLLHPRIPLYVVPWGDGRFLVGATVIESEDDGPVSARSALDLLGAAYALHPAFGEAQVLELSAGVRPAFPDNIPRLIARGRRLFINGLYRHGFLLAPVLAEAAADVIETGASDCPLLIVEHEVA